MWTSSSRPSDGRAWPTADSGAGAGRGSGQAAEEFLEEPVVLEEEMELDQVVPGERRGLGERSPRVGLGGSDRVRVRAPVAGCHPGRDQQAHDPLIGALLDVLPAGGTDERVDAVGAVL